MIVNKFLDINIKLLSQYNGVEFQLYEQLKTKTFVYNWISYTMVKESSTYVLKNRVAVLIKYFFCFTEIIIIQNIWLKPSRSLNGNNSM